MVKNVIRAQTKSKAWWLFRTERITQDVLAFAAVAIVSATLTSQASAQSFSQALVFGDSNVDSGFYKALPNPGSGSTYNAFWAAAVAAGAGAPTTNPDLMNSQILASYFGLTANPANQPGGTNFATSGAKDVLVNDGTNGGFRAATPTSTQISSYLAANGGRANASGLYLIDSGGNDVSFAFSGLPAAPTNKIGYLTGAAAGLTSAIVSLQAAGARVIVVPGQSYSFPTGNPTLQTAKLAYTQALWSDLAAQHVNFIPADFNSVRLAIAANPSAFGLQFIGNGTAQTACTKPAGITSAWALLCSSNPAAPSHLVSPDAAQTHLFADDEHLSAAGQRLQADYYYSLLVAPSQISFL